MQRPSNTVIIILIAAAVVLFLLFGGGSLPHGEMMGHGWRIGSDPGWLHPLLFIGAGILIGWAIFRKR